MKRQELADAAEVYVLDCMDTYCWNAASDDAVEAVIDLAKGRFLGVGAEQYQISETEQSFERSTVGTMLVGKIEEHVDEINYGAMIDILIGRRIDELQESRSDGKVAEALYELQRDLGETTYAAVCASILMQKHIDTLIALGEYTPRSESDYVSQLAAECEESGAVMPGASGRSSAEIEASYDGKVRIQCTERQAAFISAYLGRPVTFETPDGLDEIVAAHRMDDDGAGD